MNSVENYRKQLKNSAYRSNCRLKKKCVGSPIHFYHKMRLKTFWEKYWTK